MASQRVLRLNDEQNDLIVLASKHAGLTVSAWMRMNLLDVARRQLGEDPASKSPQVEVQSTVAEQRDASQDHTIKNAWLTLDDVLSGRCRRPDTIYEGQVVGQWTDKALEEWDASVEKLIKTHKFTAEIAAKHKAFRDAHLIVPEQRALS